MTSSSDGGGTSSDDEDSTSRTASVEALRRQRGTTARTAGRASFPSAAAVRNGSSRNAIALTLVQDCLDVGSLDALFDVLATHACRAGIRPGPASLSSQLPLALSASSRASPVATLGLQPQLKQIGVTHVQITTLCSGDAAAARHRLVRLTIEPRAKPPRVRYGTVYGTVPPASLLIALRTRCLPRDHTPHPLAALSTRPAWVSPKLPTTMKSSGVSRFLSRRDKHHEKRSSKTPPSKVCLHSSASLSSLTPLLRPHSQSLEALYHKLPSALRASVEDGLLFFQRSTPTRPCFTSTIAQVPARHSSDHLRLQSRPSHASPDLYTIFTNEDAQAAADKDADKKVRRQTQAYFSIVS